MIKKDILQQIKCKLNDLKISVISMIENLGTNDASRSTHSLREVEQLHIQLSASYVDEGYGDQWGNSVNPSSLQTWC